MRNPKRLLRGLATTLLATTLFAATVAVAAPGVYDQLWGDGIEADLCQIDNAFLEIDLERCHTTTTTAPTTTTTEPPTTTVPPTTVPTPADACVATQIVRDGNKPQQAFKIESTLKPEGEAGQRLWDAPYLFDLNSKIDNSPARWGWISGDRAGYKGAYMFLANLDTGRVVARVLFRATSESTAYMQINDKYMDEIQQTHIGYDGTCTGSNALDPQSQAQIPAITADYNIGANPAEVRPLIPIYVDGQLVEDRSYTGTVTPGTAMIRFVDLGRIDTPFVDFNGVGGTPHTVYARQPVGAAVFFDGEWVLAEAVYYDLLDADASFTP